MTTQGRHFIRPAEFSQELRISLTLVYRMIKAGELQAVRVRKQLRIPKAEYCRYCQGAGGCKPCIGGPK